MNKVCSSCQQTFDGNLLNCPYCGMPNANNVANSMSGQEVNPSSLNVGPQSPTTEPPVESVTQPVAPNPEVTVPEVSPQPAQVSESINNQPDNSGQLSVQGGSPGSLNVGPQSPTTEPPVETVAQPVATNPEVTVPEVSTQPVQASAPINNEPTNSTPPTEIVKSDTVITPTNIMQEISVEDLGETELNNANLEVVSSNAPTESLNVEEKKIELPPIPDALIADVDVSILGNKYEAEEEANNQRLLEKQRIEAEKQRIENEKREQELAKKMQVKPDLLRIDNPTPPPDQIAMMPDKKKNKKLIIIIVICLIVVIIAALAIWFLIK